MPAPILDRIRRSLDRDRALPLGHKAKKALRYAAAAALGPLHLIACDRVGPGSRTRGRPRIDNAGRIEIGARANLCSTFTPVELATGPNGRLTIGDDVFLNFGSTLSAEVELVIGDRVSVGPYAVVADADGPGAPAPIRIGDDVWLAARVRVRPGAVIGDGAVIMAGSEVVGEIPPGAIAGGVPARVLRSGGHGGAGGGGVPEERGNATGSPPEPPHLRARPRGEPRHDGASAPANGESAARDALRRIGESASRYVARGALHAADQVGARPRIHGRPFVENLGRMWIGDDLVLVSSPVQSHLVTGPRGELRIGSGVHIGDGAAIAAEDRVEIGDAVHLGRAVMILDSDYHGVGDRDAPGAAAPITIGAGAFLGDGVTVLRGARIGAGARVEPGSVVSGVIPDGAVAAGVPALVVRPPDAPSAAPAAPVADGRQTLERLLRSVVPDADLAAIAPDARLRDALDLDSMDFLRFVVVLSREIGADIPEADYARLSTLAGCEAYLAGHRC